MDISLSVGTASACGKQKSASVPQSLPALHQSQDDSTEVGYWTLTVHPKPQVTEVTMLGEAGSLHCLCGWRLGVFLVCIQLGPRDKLDREP